MRYRENKQALFFIFLVTILLFSNCSPEANYKVLSFFFDGVPNPNKTIATAANDSLSKIDSTQLQASTEKINNPEYVLHPPYAQKQCNKCHPAEGGLPLLPVPQLCYQCHEEWSKKYPALHGPVASGYCLKCHNQHKAENKKLLIRSGQDLCLYCHNVKHVMKNKNHSDIGTTDCTACHNPHGGKNRFVLK